MTGPLISSKQQLKRFIKETGAKIIAEEIDSLIWRHLRVKKLCIELMKALLVELEDHYTELLNSVRTSCVAAGHAETIVVTDNNNATTFGYDDDIQDYFAVKILDTLPEKYQLMVREATLQKERKAEREGLALQALEEKARELRTSKAKPNNSRAVVNAGGTSRESASGGGTQDSSALPVLENTEGEEEEATQEEATGSSSSAGLFGGFWSSLAAKPSSRKYKAKVAPIKK